MWDIIRWYLTLTVLGWLAFPLAYRLLPGLPGRGYALSRALGLLVWGFIFWLLGSLQLITNNLAGITLAAAALGGLSLAALRSIHWQEASTWLRRNLALVVSVEILFIAAFAAWAVVRATNPEAAGTEKPMELAFINSVMRSRTFPPHDPWLAGYGISYYYFGYILTGMLAVFNGITGSVAFNLMAASVFAMAAVGSFGVVNDVLGALDPAPTGRRNLTAALLGPLFLLLVSNWEGFLHSLHNAGVGAGAAFWRWLDILDLNQPAQPPFSFVPQNYWWWWRASRVIQDYDLAGQAKEIINEFPFFSFLLSDLHPHLLAVPFGLLAVGLALNLFLGGGESRAPQRPINLSPRRIWWAAVAMALPGALLIGLGAARLSITLALGGMILLAGSGLLAAMLNSANQDGLRVELPAMRADVFVLTATVLGGLAFMNTWDFPTYVALCAGAFILQPLAPSTGGPRLPWRLTHFIFTGAALGLTAGVLYLPFYLSFSSQAGGPVPNLIYPTRGVQMWVMFGPLFIPLFGYAAWTARRAGARRLLASLAWALAGMAALWGLALLMGLAVSLLPTVGDLFVSALGAQNRGQLFQAAFVRRFAQPGAWVSLWLLAGLGLAGLRERLQSPAAEPSPSRRQFTHVFILLLLVVGALLVIGPEFFFLRDQFGSRMNTIFKFYYQAWVLWSVAAACGVTLMMRRLPRRWGTVWGGLVILTTAAGLVYFPLSLWNKTNGFQVNAWTLDSAAGFARQEPDEWAAIKWLQNAAPGVVAEAVDRKGGAYTGYARVSTFSGQPTVLGWVGHENQWRGESAGQVIGTRQADLEKLYCSRDWNETLSVLNRYNIRYVFVGNLERVAYSRENSTCPLGLVEQKLQNHLPTAFKSGGVTIYSYYRSDSYR